MATDTPSADRAGPQDRVSRVLVWILVAVTIACSAGMLAATRTTYEQAAPIPQSMAAADGTPVLTYADIVAGKSGFQKADLMDYGSLYGMGSSFGEDYTAEYLVQLAKQVQDNLAQAHYGQPFGALDADRQSGITAAMRQQLQGIDLSQAQVVLPDAVAKAIATLRERIGESLRKDDFTRGYTGARALNPQSASQTAAFLLYSSLTTVARRPGKDYSWTSNWPSEPLVGVALAWHRHRPPHRKRHDCRRQPGDRVRDLLGQPGRDEDAPHPARGDRGEERLEVHADHHGRRRVRQGCRTHRPARHAAVRRRVHRYRVEHLPQQAALDLLQPRLGRGDHANATALGQRAPAVMAQWRRGPPLERADVGEPGELAAVDVEQPAQRAEIVQRSDRPP